MVITARRLRKSNFLYPGPLDFLCWHWGISAEEWTWNIEHCPYPGLPTEMGLDVISKLLSPSGAETAIFQDIRSIPWRLMPSPFGIDNRQCSIQFYLYKRTHAHTLLSTRNVWQRFAWSNAKSPSSKIILKNGICRNWTTSSLDQSVYMSFNSLSVATLFIIWYMGNHITNDKGWHQL